MSVCDKYVRDCREKYIKHQAKCSNICPEALKYTFVALCEKWILGGLIKGAIYHIASLVLARRGQAKLLEARHSRSLLVIHTRIHF
ncbi:hypothetical protein [Helicobacter zhangjianzhongii]|uniref:Uncharacterized protein n=1 Tax=Helicobacter zhangjianzhongii TaxID=2974574 RepID=A0ACC6FQQ5_9HELI|nr:MULTISPECIES: hypothetical protein [unclassified Helicobacter]MDL0079563.1 hypothetical protein [Helicobacter sp. CPD2-1]MDL0081536.1 hypothetical protein [Helicobacter sp. XJK30-2]